MAVWREQEFDREAREKRTEVSVPISCGISERLTMGSLHVGRHA